MRSVQCCTKWLVLVTVCVCVVCGGGGGGGQSSVVRGVREGRWQGREGVQLPDSLMNEAVLQSVGPGLETPQSPPWWQQTEEAVCRVGGITCNVEGFAGETGAVDVLEGGERDTNDLLSCSHYPLKGCYGDVLLLQEVEILTVWRTSWIVWSIRPNIVMPAVNRLKLMVTGLSWRTTIPKYASKSTEVCFRDRS